MARMRATDVLVPLVPSSGAQLAVSLAALKGCWGWITIIAHIPSPPPERIDSAELSEQKRDNRVVLATLLALRGESRLLLQR
jgi:hypothetical protein